MRDHAHDVVIIESDLELVKQLQKKGWRVLAGDATLDENLVDAGIGRAKSLITTLPDDAQNLYVVLSAREKRPDLLIISRASKSNAVSKLRVAGAQNVIMPDQVGGAHMASLVAIPDVVEFMDHIRIQGIDAVNLEEISVSQLPENLQLQTLGEMDAKNRMGVNVIGLKRASGEMVINPAPETRLDQSVKLFVLGTADQIRSVERIPWDTKSNAIGVASCKVLLYIGAFRINTTIHAPYFFTFGGPFRPRFASRSSSKRH